jgi:hypothetical protein
MDTDAASFLKDENARLRAELDAALLRIVELKRAWRRCHAQCGVEFHKVYCPFPSADVEKKDGDREVSE